MNFRQTSKANRNQRALNFESEILPKLKEQYGDKVYFDHKKNCYVIPYRGKFMDYYPKADKVFTIYKTHKGNGLNWIKNNLLNNCASKEG